jgi:hypothetical protein
LVSEAKTLEVRVVAKEKPISGTYWSIISPPHPGGENNN